MNQNNQKDNSYGLTTGSLATAASVAALKSIIVDKNIYSVEITTPFDKFNVKIHNNKKIKKNKGKASVIKYPYNDPDVTVNLEIIAIVELIDKENKKIANVKNIKSQQNKLKPQLFENIIVTGGEGVGIVTKPGLQVPVGESAINPIPMEMIKKNLKKYIPKDKIANVKISAPNGEKIAKKTMNPRLGIMNGISILGTTGIARSMSSKAYKESLVCQIDIAIAEGYEELVFVPGNIGEKLAIKKLGVKKDQIIQMGNFIGFMLEEAKKRGINKLTLFGHIGKLVKVAGGIFNTKHSVADGRKEIIGAHTGLHGGDVETIKTIFNSKTTEEMIAILKEKPLLYEEVLNSISLSIKKLSLERFDIDVKVILVDMEGNFLNSI